MIKQVAIGLAVVLAGFLGYVATQPDVYHIERSRTLPVPAAVVYDQIDDMQTWNTWDPWSDMDPNIERTYSGPSGGVGNGYAWSGNENVGKGEMTITAAEPNASVTYDLRFIEPFASHATTTIALAAEGDGTRVTWGMDGTNDFMGKLAGVFMDMDAMIGADFEKGLGKLEGVAQAAHAKAEEERKAAEAAAAAAAAEAAALADAAAAEAAGEAPATTP